MHDVATRFEPTAVSTLILMVALQSPSHEAGHGEHATGPARSTPNHLLDAQRGYRRLNGPANLGGDLSTPLRSAQDDSMRTGTLQLKHSRVTEHYTSGYADVTPTETHHAPRDQDLRPGAAPTRHRPSGGAPGRTAYRGRGGAGARSGQSQPRQRL